MNRAHLIKSLSYRQFSVTPLIPCNPKHLPPSPRQVGANQPNASYRLLQKERVALRFPFSITDEGEVLLNEELDREEKDMVSGVTMHSHRGKRNLHFKGASCFNSYMLTVEMI